MKFKATYLSLLTALTIVCATPAMAAPKGWEQLKTEQPDARTVVKEQEIEIKTSGSSLIVTTTHSVQIKIFTILGRQISSDHIQPGTSRLTLPAHGVYIVKAGEMTFKIAL